MLDRVEVVVAVLKVTELILSMELRGLDLRNLNLWNLVCHGNNLLFLICNRNNLLLLLVNILRSHLMITITSVSSISISQSVVSRIWIIDTHCCRTAQKSSKYQRLDRVTSCLMLNGVIPM